MHDREFPENTDQTQHHRQQLRQHSGIGSSLHSGLKSQDKQIIQPDVAHRCHDQKDQRCQDVYKRQEYASLQLLLQREQDISEYYKTLITETENKNRFIHDIKKHLQSIAILNQNGEAEKIDSYINTLINSSELQTSVRLCNHELLNAIFCRYLMQCRKDNIDFRTDIRKDTCTFLNETDMTSLFCNLLDNALEAARYIPCLLYTSRCV